MILAGLNLYRVIYGFKHCEAKGQRLVVAHSEKEAMAYFSGEAISVELVERDISMLIPSQYIAAPSAERT